MGDEEETHLPNLGGRPTKFKDEYIEQARKLCALGATDSDLADFFGVSDNTIDNWKHRHPEFLGAIKNAKEHADDRVERSLYQRAVGYKYDAIKIFQYEGSEVVVPYRENVVPDVTAAIFWLKNRRREQWRDRSDLALSDPDGKPLIPVINVSIGRDQPEPTS